MSALWKSILDCCLQRTHQVSAFGVQTYQSQRERVGGLVY